VHIDMDSLDPRVAPGVLLAPVPAGMSLEHMEESLRAVFARFRVKAATLAVYDPDHDHVNIQSDVIHMSLRSLRGGSLSQRSR